MLRSLRTNSILWLTLALLALTAALSGVSCPRLYDPVMSNKLRP